MHNNICRSNARTFLCKRLTKNSMNRWFDSITCIPSFQKQLSRTQKTSTLATSTLFICRLATVLKSWPKRHRMKRAQEMPLNVRCGTLRLRCHRLPESPFPSRSPTSHIFKSCLPNWTAQTRKRERCRSPNAFKNGSSRSTSTRAASAKEMSAAVLDAEMAARPQHRGPHILFHPLTHALRLIVQGGHSYM